MGVSLLRDTFLALHISLYIVHNENRVVVQIDPFGKEGSVKIHLIVGVTLVVVMSSLFGAGQTPANNNDRGRMQAQFACEDQLLRDAGAKEVLDGDEYEILQSVATAFGLNRAPRLYFFEGGSNSYYIAGSFSLDGRGKILISRKFADLIGGGLAFKGVVAHETAHLVVDVHGDTGCDQWVMRDPKIEKAADALAATKVGFGPLKAFLMRVEKMTGTTSGETESRLQALEKLEAQKNGQR
jgi:hypothetical protein